jgi:hypothetical protein
MREFLLVFAVVLAILALTAFKYRRQLAALVGVIRFLSSDQNGRATRIDPPRHTGNAGQLVKCDICGIWVPEEKGRVVGSLMTCSDKCLAINKLDEHS